MAHQYPAHPMMRLLAWQHTMGRKPFWLQPTPPFQRGKHGIKTSLAEGIVPGPRHVFR